MRKGHVKHVTDQQQAVLNFLEQKREGGKDVTRCKARLMYAASSV